MADITVTVLYGFKYLKPEFVFITRKRIRGFFYDNFQYYTHTPYVKVGPFESYEEALIMKIGFNR